MTKSLNPQFAKSFDGALLVDKRSGVSSFGVIEELQAALMRVLDVKKNALPKLGHGGTLDPFATGLLPVCMGKSVKLARYFLGGRKGYEGVIRFGETTLPGDPTAPISEKTEAMPASLEQLRDIADKLTKQPYLQTPPMFSAKKVDGKPLYELAREGKTIEREPKLCHLYKFDVWNYDLPRAFIRVHCSSGTYIRTLAQDFAVLAGSLGLLESLRRTQCSSFAIERAWTVEKIAAALEAGQTPDEMECFVPFDRILDGYDHAEATEEERLSLFQGKQAVLFSILKRAERQPDHPESCVAIYHRHSLVAVARRAEANWEIERVFVPT